MGSSLTMQKHDDRIVLEPATAATACVIWLHGLGADGGDFVPIIPELGLEEDAGIRFIFPHAPVQPVTINGGMKMRAWFDIYALGSLDRQDEAGIEASAQRVRDLIAEQNAAGIPCEKIVLAGFSQGGAIVLQTATRHPEALAGVLALSTYLPLHTRLGAEKASANQQVPILMCHGSFDPVLPLQLGAWSRDLLLSEGYAVDWREYPMQHQVCAEQISDISRWLKARL